MRTLVVLVALALVGGCSPMSSTTPVDSGSAGTNRRVATVSRPPDATVVEGLAGREWRLIELGPEHALPSEPVIFLRFEPERLTGQSACNEFFADVKVLDANDLRVGVIGATRMMCAAETMRLEQAFFDRLHAVRRWRTDDGRLYLEWNDDTHEGAMVFENRGTSP